MSNKRDEDEYEDLSMLQNLDFISNMHVIYEAEYWMKNKMDQESKEVLSRHDERDFNNLCSILRSKYPCEELCKQNRDSVLNQIEACYSNKEKMKKLTKEEQSKLELIARLYGVFPEEKQKKSFFIFSL